MSSKQNNTIIACISYWIRERYYGTALAQVDKSLAAFPSEMNSTRMGLTTEPSGTGDAKLTLLLLKAYCLCKLGRTADSTRLLQPLIGQFPSSKIAILHTLRIVHLSESTVDKETLRDIERQIQTEWMESSDESAYLAALILLLENLVDRARLFLDKLNSAGNSRYLALHGWADIIPCIERNPTNPAVTVTDFTNAIALFDQAIALDNSADAFLGKVKAYELSEEPEAMRNALNAMLDADASLLVGYIELAKAAAMT